MPQSDTTIAALERASFQLDELIREMRLGRPSQGAHDRRIEAGEQIAASIRSAFRGGHPARKEAQPLQVARDGQSAWW